MNAAFMKESWHKALTTILEDLTQLILKMYVFNAINKAFNVNQGGGGSSFFQSFMSGLFGGGGGGGGGSSSGGGSDGGVDFGGGFASGGYASAGMSYLVGERGPELFTPGSSGAITPSGGLGHQTFNIDARGADVSVEKRIRALLPIVEDRAVVRAMAGVADRNARK